MTIDLTNWNYTAPVDKDGRFMGEAVEVKAAPFPAYLIANPDGSLTFSVPVIGVTTSGSHYPRSELREMIKGKKAAWHIADGGKLTATLAINELPVPDDKSKHGRVVIGQIHGPSDELCRLYYDNGKLYFHDDKSGQSHHEVQFDLKNAAGKTSNIALNEKFTYSITVSKGILSVTALYAGMTYMASESISSFWPKKALYFKAGVYCQVGKPGSKAGTIGTGRATATFYEIIRS